MVTLSEWSSDYFKYSPLTVSLWNYISLDSEEEILVYSVELLRSNDIIAFGAVADVFLESMPNFRWGQMNPYWSLKRLLREKSIRVLLEDSVVGVTDQEINKEILIEAYYEALSVLSFIGYEEKDIEVAWRVIMAGSSIPALISTADSVILHALPYIVNISSCLKSELINYYIRCFIEEQNPYHLSILNNLGGNRVAETLEEVFLSTEEKRTGIRTLILEECLYSPHIDISNRFRSLGQEYYNLYAEMKEVNETENFPLSDFKFKNTKQILDALDDLESVITRLKREQINIEERAMMIESWLTERVFDLLYGKLHHLDFFKQLPNQVSAYVISRLLDFSEEDYAGILKLKGIAEILSADDKRSFSNALLKAERMIPPARIFNEQNQLYPME